MRLAFLALVFGAGVWAGVKTSHLVRVDACLDAGGAWSEALGLCRGIE